MFADITSNSIANIAAHQMGKKVGVLGDSNTAIAYNIQSSFGNWNLQGWPAWLRILSKQSLIMSSSNVYATNGATTSVLISTWLSTAVAAQLDIYVVAIGVNDCQTMSVATYSANIDTICNALLSTGAIVVLVTIHPNTVCSAAQFKILNQMNNVLRAKAASNSRILLADPIPYLADMTVTTGAPVSGMLYDTVHYANKGAYLVAKTIWNVLSSYTPYTDKRFNFPNDVWANDNVNGNLLTNGMLNGSSGSVDAGVGLSGVAPNNWTFHLGSASGTMAVVGSKVAKNNGEQGGWFRATFSGTPVAAKSIYLLQSISYGGGSYSAGDVIEMTAEFRINSGSAGIRGVFAQISDASSGSTGENDGTSSTGHLIYSGDTITGVLKPEPHTIVASAGSVLCSVIIQTDAAATSGDIDIGPISVRKIT